MDRDRALKESYELREKLGDRDKQGDKLGDKITDRDKSSSKTTFDFDSR